MGRKVWKHSPKQYITLCYSLIEEPWHDTYQVYAYLDNFCSAALLSWPQGHHQCPPSLPSPLGIPPHCPWPRIPFQPSEAISPAQAMLQQWRSSNSPKPCPAQPRVPSIQAHPWANVPARPHPQGGDWWFGLLAESGCGVLWGWALTIRLGLHLN